MAKSPTEQIRDSALEVRALRERDAQHDREIQRLRDQADQDRQARVAAEREVAVLRQQLQDHVAQYQEWDRRRWGMYVLFFSTVLSLASGLVVTLAKK